MKTWIVVSVVLVLIVVSGFLLATRTPAHAAGASPNVVIQWVPGTDLNRLVDNDLNRVCYFNDNYIYCLPK